MPIVALFAAFFLSVLSPLTAQAQDELSTQPTLQVALPIEVSLMYQKLQNVTPDYDGMIAANPNLQSDPSRFGNSALLQQQRDTLKKIYDDFTPDTVFLVKKTVTLSNANRDTSSVTLSGLSPDEPFVFSLTDTDHYGIFLRNAKDLTTIAPPYYHDEFFRIAGAGKVGMPVVAEMIVKPLAADTELFQAPDGKQVKPVIADVVEITLYGKDGTRVGIIKRFNNWRPGGKASSFLDLKDNPLDGALAK